MYIEVTTALLSSANDIAQDTLNLDASFLELGINSVLAVELVEAINRNLGIELGVEVMFDYRDIKELTHFIFQRYGKEDCSKELPPLADDVQFSEEDTTPISDNKTDGPAIEAESEDNQEALRERRSSDVAIIGISGRFAGSTNIEAFWQHLQAGESCIEEIKRKGWETNAYYDPDPECMNTSISKWGGMLQDIDKFDPLFFYISPLEAARMDPQQRLFLEEAYSLYAIHLACESIKRGECAMAIAGGVNLSLHPSKYISLCVAQFASSDGRCRSFGQDGDGYVPGEGVGAVLLKPLRDAIADGDHIHAVIKGTAVNNDGKTFGYSVPNPVAQTEVIRKALEVAHVDPCSISYVEAHGTGTRLGDPIEITGLSDAFKEYTSAKQFCAIGSVKSNIGHLEAAAGISQVAKVVLQMKHKKLVPSLLHTSKLNPHIDFENTPFFVQQTLEEWKIPVIQANGEEVVYPRRTGISSFGAGGVNVHIVLEEYQKENGENLQGDLSKEPVIIVLSAKKEQNLRDYAQSLKEYVEKNMQALNNVAKLKDMACTLQTGRDPLPCRLAFTARDVEEIIEKLEIFLNQREVCEKNGLYVEYSTTGRKPGTEQVLDNLSTVRSSPAMAEKVTELWASGEEIDWESMYQNEQRFRMPLPTYPFSKERYWVGEGLEEETGQPSTGAVGADQPQAGAVEAFRGRDKRNAFFVRRLV